VKNPGVDVPVSAAEPVEIMGASRKPEKQKNPRSALGLSAIKKEAVTCAETFPVIDQGSTPCRAKPKFALTWLDLTEVQAAGLSPQFSTARRQYS
jgi:hypothetical protein